MIEGGDKLTNYVIKHKLVNKFYLFQSPKKLLIDKKHVVFTSNKILKENYRIKSKINTKLVTLK